MRNENPADSTGHNSNIIVVTNVVLIVVAVICGGEFGSERMAVTTGKRVK